MSGRSGVRVQSLVQDVLDDAKAVGVGRVDVIDADLHRHRAGRIEWSRAAGGPQIPGPASLMAPNAIRRTVLSPSRTLSGASGLARRIRSPRSSVDTGQPLRVERDRRNAETRKKIPPSVA